MGRAWKKLRWGVVLSTVFILALRPSSDSDLGWHLRYGEYFWTTGRVQQNNPYSTPLPDYKWTNISWGLDVVDYGVYRLAGFAGLSILAAGAITAAYGFMLAAFSVPYLLAVLILPIWWWVNRLFIGFGWRGQVVSTLYMSVLAFILSRVNTKPKLALVLPILFFLWSNTHGTFVMGLGLVGMWLLLKIRDGLAGDSKYILVALAFTASIVSSMVHPFGARIYTEALKHFNHPSLTKVDEWKSPFYFERVTVREVVWTGLVVLGLIVLIQSRKRELWEINTMGFTLLIFSFVSTRYMTPMTIFTIPLVVLLGKQFLNSIPKKLDFGLSGIMIISIGFVMILGISKNKFWALNWDRYCIQYWACSPQIAEYIIDHNLNNEKLFTAYGLGGWLIWNYPEIKPYIDGRMHLWQENGFSPFEEFYLYNMNKKSLDNSAFDSAFIVKTTLVYPDMTRLVSQGKWVKEMETPMTAIFTRKK